MRILHALLCGPGAPARKRKPRWCAFCHANRTTTGPCSTISIAKWSFIVADRLDAGERLREPIAKDIVAVLIGLILRMAIVAAPSSLPENHQPERRRTWRRTDALTSGWRRLASAMPRLPRSRLAIYVYSLTGSLLSTTLITTGFRRKRGHFGGFKAWLNQRLSQEIPPAHAQRPWLLPVSHRSETHPAPRDFPRHDRYIGQRYKPAHRARRRCHVSGQRAFEALQKGRVDEVLAAAENAAMGAFA